MLFGSLVLCTVLDAVSIKSHEITPDTRKRVLSSGTLFSGKLEVHRHITGCPKLSIQQVVGPEMEFSRPKLDFCAQFKRPGLNACLLYGTEWSLCISSPAFQAVESREDNVDQLGSTGSFCLLIKPSLSPTSYAFCV